MPSPTVNPSTTKTPARATAKDVYTPADVHPARGVHFGNRHTAGRTFRSAVRAGRFPSAPTALLAAAGAPDAWRAVIAAPRDRSHESAVASLVDDLIAGRPVDPTALDEALAAGEHARGAQARLIALDGVIAGALDDRWNSLLTEAAPGLVPPLRDRLQVLVAEGRTAAAALGRLDTTDPVAVAGASLQQSAALLTLTRLAAEYDDLRHLHQLAVAVVVDRPDARPATLSISHHAGWTEIFARGLAEFRRAPARGTLPPAKPGPDATARFRQVVQRDDVWCPSAEDVIALADVVTGSAAA